MKAAPISRNVTQVISHSPSHSSDRRLDSSVGLSAEADLTGFTSAPWPPNRTCRWPCIDREHAIDRRFVVARRAPPSPYRRNGPSRRKIAGLLCLRAALRPRHRARPPAHPDGVWATGVAVQGSASSCASDCGSAMVIGSGVRLVTARGIADRAGCPAARRSNRPKARALGEAVVVDPVALRDRGADLGRACAEAVVDIHDDREPI